MIPEFEVTNNEKATTIVIKKNSGAKGRVPTRRKKGNAKAVLLLVLVVIVIAFQLDATEILKIIDTIGVIINRVLRITG